ncbi:MAG: aldo/keto reductase [Deltaproteobacteria bacterium]|nr:aldo/keto reductase [Deltaproteobacteria bacterium]
MRWNPLGRSKLPVSRIGLGLAALGRPGYMTLGHADDLRGAYDVEAMRAGAHAVLDAAWDAGVRYFDVARSYGRGEEFLASWLAARAIDPDAVTVGSKWGYEYTAGWRVEAAQHEVKEHSEARLERQWGESRALLGAQLDVYHIHSATLESGVLEDRAVLTRLARLRDAGVVIGLSVTGMRQAEVVRRALAISIDGTALFGVVQATWNLLERSAGEALAEAHAAGLGVIIKEGLANGRLTERNVDPGFAAAQARLRGEAQRLDCTLDALALAAILARPWADVVLSGAATAAHLRANLAARSVRWDDPAEAALAELAEPVERYWTTRAALAWN